MSGKSYRNRIVTSILAILLLFQGLSGIAGGALLVIDPSGGILGFPPGWLGGSPFRDYLVPGLILLIVLGVGPLAVWQGVRTRHRLAIPGALITGIALLIWIIVEIMIIGYQKDPPLQLAYGSVGAAITVLSGIALAGRR
jgi:hypothetical protein